MDIQNHINFMTLTSDQSSLILCGSSVYVRPYSMSVADFVTRSSGFSSLHVEKFLLYTCAPLIWPHDLARQTTQLSSSRLTHTEELH